MRQLGLILQEPLRREGESRTILDLFAEQMESGVDREPRRRRTLKERLRLTGIGCCGATCGFGPAAISVEHEEEEEGQRQEQQPLQEANSGLASNSSDPECVVPASSSSSMNLAAALAAERQHRGSQEPDGGTGTVGPAINGSDVRSGGAVPGTPWRVSLMRLLEETDSGDVAAVTDTEKGVAPGNDSVCCVCMGRKKGAAFIPCGHTFCRVCSRELWLNRGSCPLCNRSILEILDIF
ncbi:hypothetical protein L6164_032272 [Bauhinia variegata]|uniref:Uncharacterized protein n=1 Tax=Bauhinia variegata TaxID=167791 RepID=A0ACB9KNY5_BAUVA|nr:hypothetical protein L6164_032272 [Bauhinia variegata]